jgi:hypothetical protein
LIDSKVSNVEKISQKKEQKIGSRVKISEGVEQNYETPIFKQGRLVGPVTTETTSETAQGTVDLGADGKYGAAKGSVAASVNQQGKASVKVESNIGVGDYGFKVSVGVSAAAVGAKQGVESLVNAVSNLWGSFVAAHSNPDAISTGG